MLNGLEVEVILIKILMIGKPGGTLARTYEWHIEALNSDKEKRFEVHDSTIIKENIDIGYYDVFWFYAKAFNPPVYEQIIKLRPDAKIICGPNILLDKPDIGIADQWDEWYCKVCKPHIHLDQVEFYSNHVQKFLSDKTRSVAKTLDKCMKIDDSFYNSTANKIYDCLVYSKKRRYDYQFESFRNELISLLDLNNITYFEIKAGKYGSYKREDYFDALNKSKITVNLSLDECPGILNYESMFFNVPVIGSPHNVPINSDQSLYVLDSDYMSEKYLVRKDDAAKKYFKKISEVLKKDTISLVNQREWILNHTSFSNYCKNVSNLMEWL